MWTIQKSENLGVEKWGIEEIQGSTVDRQYTKIFREISKL